MPYAHYFAVLSSHVEAIIVAGGYPFLFLAVLLEGLPLVGTVVPGHVAIIAGGFLARIGILNIWVVLILAVIGAVAGDYIGFLLGRRYGLSLIDRLKPYFFISDAQVNKAQALLAKHTGKAMIIGRFSPVTRALMPFLVGSSNAPSGKFWLFNIIGGVSWAGLSVMLGYAFGAGYHAVAEYFGKFVLIAILLAIITVWGYRFVNMRFHIFRRYELFVLGLNLVSLWVLAKTIQDAFSSSLSKLTGFDISVNMFMADHVTPFLANLGTWISNIGGTTVLGIAGLLITIVLAFRRKWRSAAIMFIAIGSTSVLLGIMKEFFMRVRPDNALQVIVNDPSFPSGHAGMAAAFFLVVVYLAAPIINSWVKRELMIVMCVLAVIAIGLSRLVLNVHWASDVIAGWSLGIFCATASILLVKYVGELVMKKKNV